MNTWSAGHYLSPDIACAPRRWDSVFGAALAELAEGKLSLPEAQRRLHSVAPTVYFFRQPEHPYDASVPESGVGENEFQITNGRAIVRLHGPITTVDRAKWESMERLTSLIIDLRSAPGMGVRDLATRSSLLESPQALSVLGKDLAELPSIQTLGYKGFPSEVGFSSGYYSSDIRATVTSQYTRIGKPLKDGGARAPTVIVIGNADTVLPRVLLSARFRGRARFITTNEQFQYGGLPSTASRTDTTEPVLRLARFAGYDLGNALRPDAVTTDACADDASCVDRVIKSLPPAREFSQSLQCSELPTSDPDFAVDPSGLPGPAGRVYALAKIYETLRLFHPRGTQIDALLRKRLRTGITEVLGARSATAYAVALSRFVAGTGDAHLEIVGTSMFRAIGLGAPAIDVRLVGDRLIASCVATPTSEVHAGDEILTIGGTPALVRLTEIRQILSAHSGQRGLESAARYALRGPVGSTADIQIRSPEGPIREVNLPRFPLSRSCGRSTAPKEAPFAWLARHVAYIDLARLSPPSLEAALSQLESAKSLIVDLRRYPQGGAWILAAHRSAARSFPVALFETPLVDSAYADPSEYQEARAVLRRQQWVEGDRKPLITAKTYVLVDEATLSQGEHSVLLLRAAAPLTIVGRTTGGSDGDMTGMKLPGALALRFTGQEVKMLDGKAVFGTGIKPDKLVPISIDEVSGSKDTILSAALELAR